MDKIGWPMVTLIASTVFMVVSGVCVLTWLKADASVITGLISLLGTGGLIGIVMGVRNTVNGNSKRQMDMIQDALEKISKSPPIKD